MNKQIFKEYDIRGKYPQEIDEKTCFEIGKALAITLKNKSAKNFGNLLLKNRKKIAVARDMRKSSPSLARTLSEGILSTGISVDYIGMSSTPALYWAVAKKEYMGGAIVTASHNSSEFNGVKICGALAAPVSPQELLLNIKRRDAKFCVSTNTGLQRKSYIEEYIKFIKNYYQPEKNRHLKIAVDAAWAMASDEIPFILNGLDIDFIPICFGPTENFSNKDINPSNKGALDDLSRCIKKYKAEIGIAFDGDADRVLFMDEKGELIDPEIITSIIGASIVGETSTSRLQSRLILDSRSGRQSQDPLQKMGFKTIISRSGHSNIKEAMMKNRAVFGAETSGHYYFNIGSSTQWAPADNATIAILKVLSALASSNSSISTIAKKYDKFRKSRELNFEVSNPEKVLSEIENHFSKANKTLVSRLDGLTMEFPAALGGWRFNLRPSHTEPEILRLNIEAKKEDVLGEMIREMRKIITKKPA